MNKKGRKNMAKNGKIQAITRLIVTAILFTNAILTAMGKNPIPLDESMIGEAVSIIASIVTIVWSWWKNANITENALRIQAWKESMEKEKK